MRIGALSDTHASSLADLPPRIVEELRHVDLIVHVGDYTSRQVLDDLRALGSFRGVAGNMDRLSIRAELPDQDIIEVEGRRIGLTHGNGAPAGLASRVRQQFAGDIDVIIYGHSHMAGKETVNGVLMFNPGSATGRWPANRASFGILTIDERGVEAEIVWV